MSGPLSRPVGRSARSERLPPERWAAPRIPFLRPWREASDLLVAVIPLALTVLLLMGGFTPILKTLSDPNTTWTGFAYQALPNKLSAYTLALQTADQVDRQTVGHISGQAASRAAGTLPATLERLREQAFSSLDNPEEYPELRLVENIGVARLSRVRELFTSATTGGTSGGSVSPRTRLARLSLAIEEAAMLNEQSHERIHQVQQQHAEQLKRLRLVLLLAAALSGLLSTALIWRSLQLWRGERQMLDGQRELLSLASHELRRPLQSLLLATDLLRGAQNPEDRLRYLSVVENSASQLASRANLEQLAEMYQRVQLDWQPVDLAALLLQFQGPRTEVQLSGQQPTIQADPARLRQIVENLHENALRYSSGTVCLSLLMRDGQPEIQVRDSGPGIDPGEVERLFLPRERGSAGSGHTGKGLGLTIARRLAQAHGADLSLQVAPGGGTLAALRFRAAPDPERRRQQRQD